MSYGSEIKLRLCSEIPKKPCCRKAFLLGALFVSATCEDGILQMPLSGDATLKTLIELVSEVYHAECQVTPRRGAGGVTLCFSSPSALRFLSCLEEGGDVNEQLRCQECHTYFLRGVFLLCAYPQDPNSGFRFDFMPHCRVEMLEKYLSDRALPPKRSIRGGRALLYYRSAEGVGNILALMGLTDMYFDLQDTYVRGSISNLTNRQNNCSFRNISRSVDRLSQHREIIRRMKDLGKFSLLSDELRLTADLILENAEATLSGLARLSVPPLTKSGLNNRLKRILKIAADHGV